MEDLSQAVEDPWKDATRNSTPDGVAETLLYSRAMPSTFLALNVHIVFGTKHQAPLISPDQIEDAHRYLGGTLRGLEAVPLRVGGLADHVHLLVGLRGKHSVSDLVREVKKASTAWMRTTESNFAWQEGYAAFSVSPQDLPAVDRYIANQEAHHARTSFAEEYEELLRLAGIEFDSS